jgi:hypothetical protein
MKKLVLMMIASLFVTAAAKADVGKDKTNIDCKNIVAEIKAKMNGGEGAAKDGEGTPSDAKPAN